MLDTNKKKLARLAIGKLEQRYSQNIDIRNPNKLNLELRNILRILSLLLLDSFTILATYFFFKSNKISLLPILQSSDILVDRFSYIFLAFNLLFLYVCGLYRRGSKSRSLVNTFKGIFLAFLSLSIITLGFYGKSSLIWLGIIWIFVEIVFISYRLLFFKILSFIRNRYLYLKIRTILVGNEKEIKVSLPVLNKSKDFVVISLFDISRYDELEKFVSLLERPKLEKINEILICSASWQKLQTYPEIFWKLRCSGISWQIIQLDTQIYQHELDFSKIEELTTVKVVSPIIAGVDFLSKRVFDIVVSILLLIVLASPMIIIAVLIKIDSSGSVLYKQTRVGLKGKHFEVWKFRTMVSNANELQKHLEAKNEVKGGILFKIKEDPRITRVGKYLRRYSIDELPQLFNVLLGEMSLVGPRPLPDRDVSNFSEEHHFRHQVLPGITGLWQVSGRSDTNSNNVFLLDFEYIKNWSLMLDFKILLKTIKVVFNSKGAY